ncbi:MAG: glyoxylate reductase (NADP(+)) [Mesorhizobium sp.]|uniref:NAD(P)-dependent oxidoreductase n=1 Tax=Mesorhizobium sp. TaxID=1871066 RepID=UPI000FE47CAF|nr:NAD(P)-dependent oxidoreductase [Mesorhizobium sp.]RWB81214.1 MAG: glyoxylate reductase (NADP(+)) [Mesorhizobium sp.]RWF79304.1 MAG: glyoxylate reductase (NADP(+)) [Mesorhizobium sp.]TIS68470.1 MAG: glyoxylate reductase (NADP(+)) [Mesorhizobium sp.]TIW51099.1 MAG: glyoxylate reductase (NADP(+)) [Mesorhizobium sp.]
MLTILNHQGQEMERELLAHWSKPKVVTPPVGTPRWQWPSDIDVLLTTPSGWEGAPARPVPGFERLRLVQMDTVGIDRYPEWLLHAPNVANARGSNSVPLAEYVMSAVLGFEKRFIEARITRREEWRHIPMGQVEDRVIGIAGYGAVGQAIAHLAKAFGMRIAAFKRTPWEQRPKGVLIVDSIGELAEISDHLVLACPLTPETRYLVDGRVLASARRGMHLINVARGGLIEERALLKALNDGTVDRASLDVTEPEPLPGGHAFYTHPKVRLTPHVSWESSANSGRMRRIVLDNIDALIDGAQIRNLIDIDRGY